VRLEFWLNGIEAMATAESIRQAKHAQPFQPFFLRLVDGTVYDVKHPDYISIPPTLRPREAIYYVVTDGEGEGYQTRWIDLGLVMEVIVPTSPSAQPTATR
jgi:hypothetical protein